MPVPFISYNTSLTEYARQNRKAPTPTERKFRNFVLRRKKFLGYKFRRQKVVGSFILDFYCSKLLLGIEIDGGYHKKRKEYDAMREEIIRSYGVRIVRFSNEEIEYHLAEVIETLEVILHERQMRLSPP